MTPSPNASKIRLFCDRIQHPNFMMQLHLYLTLFWGVASVPLCLLIDGNLAERFLVFISLYAVVTGHWSAWQASRVEVEQLNQAAGD